MAAALLATRASHSHRTLASLATTSQNSTSQVARWQVRSAPVLSTSLLVQLKGRCVVAGPPLHETIKLLSPLTNLEVLALSGNKMGGRFTAEVAAFTKLNELSLVDMGLDGTSLRTHTERFGLRD